MHANATYPITPSWFSSVTTPFVPEVVGAARRNAQRSIYSAYYRSSILLYFKLTFLGRKWTDVFSDAAQPSKND